jgi:uncharacterized membrane protein
MTEETKESLFVAILLLNIPLGLWKFIEIIIWIVKHVHIYVS